MSRLRQFVSGVMILAVVTMLNAPLIACEMAGHRCTMMAHASQPAQQVQLTKAKHDCCPKKGTETPSNKKQSCHQSPAALPMETAASMNCCNMGSTSVVAAVTPTIPVKKAMLAAITGPPPDLFTTVQHRADYPSPPPPPPRAVLALKTDLRI